MRVCQCVNYFHPSVGGTQLATYYLSRSLAQLGIDVKIVTFNVNPSNWLRTGYYSANLPSYEEMDGIPVYRFPVVLLGKTSGQKPRYKIIVSPSAVKMLLRENPDIIHFQGASEISQSIISSFASNFSASKTVLTVHGLHAQVAVFKKHRFLKQINELLLRLALGTVNRIIALSEYDLEIIRHLKISTDKVSVIPNGIDLSRFLTTTQETDFPLQAPSVDAPFVLCVTRIRENKGIEILIRAAADVASKKPDVKFLLVGNCSREYAARLLGLIKKVNMEKNFILKGYIPHKSELLPELYRHARIFVLPSLMESFPLVLLEAMASGLPIVATRVGGIPDIISPSEGILVPPGDVASLSSSLLFLLENDNVRVKLGQNARKRAESYSWKKIAQRTISLYERLLAN